MFFVTVSHADISLHIILIHPLDKIIYQREFGIRIA